MKENKMTEAEIMKALECCGYNAVRCFECPFMRKDSCTVELLKDSLALINRKNAENEDSQIEKEHLVVFLAEAKAENERLEYTLAGVMHSVDKWLDGDELKQDEVNRAITMREKTLRIVETARAEAIKEVLEKAKAIANNWDGTICDLELDQIAKEMGVEL